MNKGFLLLGLGLIAIASASAKDTSKAAADKPGSQVLMTIKGKPVTLGEFEYLYHKNNSQQAQEQSIPEYLDMFVVYKQKVADAEAEGIDKSEAFRTEYEGYRRELAEPYMRIQEVEDSLVSLTYNRMKEEVLASHIMLPLQGTTATGKSQPELLDSIRTAIVGGADFATLARQFSIDRSVSQNGGSMGYIVPGRFPYSFEDMVYNTEVGQISPVFATPFGYHIVQVYDRRPGRGQVLVEHILKLTQGLPEEAAAQKKAQIDSIAGLLAAGGDFEAIAKAESEDPGSARSGGKLQWFGVGMMVPEFEDAAYNLKVGETSEPVKTAYGYHIIRKLDQRDIEPFDVARSQIKSSIAQDERARMPRQRKMQQLRAKYGAKIDNGNLDAIRAEIVANRGLDSVLYNKYLLSNMVLASVQKQELLLSEIVSQLSNEQPGAPSQQADMLEDILNKEVDNMVAELEREDMEKTNPDYANLLNEYRDGMLLFEVSDKKVWSKAKNDKEGLEKYFNTHRAKYKWDKPRYKGYVVFATNDSTLQEARAYLDANNFPNDQLTSEMRKKFGKEIKIERVIAAQGENAITDYLGFGGEKPEPKGKWACYFAYRDKVVDAPEDATDVRGAVTADYQNDLEAVWLKDLKKKYPAKVNKKVLQQAK